MRIWGEHKLVYNCTSSCQHRRACIACVRSLARAPHGHSVEHLKHGHEGDDFDDLFRIEDLALFDHLLSHLNAKHKSCTLTCPHAETEYDPRVYNIDELWACCQSRGAGH